MSHKGKINIWIMKKGGLKSMLRHSNSRHQRVKQVHRDNIIPFKQACTDTQPAIPIDVQVDQPQSIKRIPKIHRLKKI